MSWIKFHEELCSGEKRGISRATRFVYLELSLRSRPTNGVIKLPRGMSDVDAVHDLIGGNKAEIKRALAELSAPAVDMVRLDGDGARTLVIPTWLDWNRPDRNSTERVRLHREKKRSEPPEGGNGETQMKRVSTERETPTERTGNENVTRSEKTLPLSSSVDSSSFQLQTPSQSAGARAKTRFRHPETMVPASDATPEEIEAFCAKWKLERPSDPRVQKFLNVYRRTGKPYRDWAACWRVFLDNEGKFANGSGKGRIVQEQKGAPEWMEGNDF